MEFEKRKASSLVSMASTSTDKSPKGTLDAPIIPLLNSINNHPSYFTTSSCSGRISILSQPFNITTKKKKARGGSWIFITHEPANTSIVTDLLFPTATEKGWGEGEVESELVFRFEPLIIAIECKDLGAAQGLVATAIACGFRESGITSVCKRVIIAIRCSIRLEVPLGLVGNVMVSREYVEYLVGISNEKMQSNRKRTDCFLQVLESKLLCNQVVEAKSGLVNAEGGDGDCGAESTTEVTVGDCNLEKTDLSSHSGSLDLQCRNSLLKIVIVGEPVDKLFLWGHSACTLNNEHYKKVVVFGGFGGQGRHARRNDSLMLDPFSGTLVAVNVEGPPSPRLSHTSSVTGECIFIIGGRGDPLKILNDVWVLDMARNEWSLLECAGSVFHPRHRHAAAVVDGKIYVFGGLDNETVSSSMQVLNTESSRWSDISVQGEWPCARHSHSLVAVGSLLFMFGGYDGEKALGDLYSFDTKTFLWKKEKTTGRTPYPRFSHSMFLYKNYVGIIGGCPVRQHFQEVALLDMRHSSWRHITLDSIGGNMFVRSTASVVDDDLVMIGGGASCYAFGTKFSKPTKLHLLPLTYPDDSHTSTHMEEIPIIHKPKESAGKDLELCTGAEYHVLKLERKYAKMAKDILKQFGWLDLGRKVYSRGNGLHIYLPVTEKFYTLFLEVEHDYRDPSETLNDLNLVGTATSEIFLVNNVSYQIPLNHLFSCGGSLLVDEAVCLRKALKSPHKRLSETVGSLIKQKGLSQKLLEQIPTRWGQLGDVLVLPTTSFKDPIWDSIGDKLWPSVARSLGTCRLARQGRIAPTGTRDSTLEILVGNDGWVHHRENGIFYSFDATKCMFSWGNLSEKLRMANLDCREEVIVDLFAGIGYFVLPFLVRAKAKFVYACEWNPHAVEALRRNIEANSVVDRCVILEGDNRVTSPKGIADRVCLGLLPSSEGSWPNAVRALRPEGGMLHVHGNVKDSEENFWSEHVAKSISDIAKSEGLFWEVSVQHVERVKWYGPHIRHLVADVRCKQLLSVS